MTNDDPNELALFVPTYLKEILCIKNGKFKFI
jgi:hypothetical protein